MIRSVFWILLAIVWTVPAYGQVADKILRGGSIVTVDDAKPFAEAVAVKDGKILAVGSNDEIAKFQDTKTEIVDLAGRALLPGFVVGGLALSTSFPNHFKVALRQIKASRLQPVDFRRHTKELPIQ